MTIRYSDRSQEILQSLKEEGLIGEMRDGFRLGIGLAIASGVIAERGIRMKTFLNVGSFDGDGTIRNVILELYPNEPGTPYEIAERLAEAGVAEIGRLHDNDQLRFTDLFAMASRTSEST